MPGQPNADTAKADYKTMVIEAENGEYPEVEHDAYEFSGKKFTETDQNGVYGND